MRTHFLAAMYLLRYGHFAALLVLIGGCVDSENQGMRGVEVSVTLEQTFGDPALLGDDGSALLQSISSVQIDDDGNVYVLDSKRGPGRLLSYSPSGSLRWALDANGEAPGELHWVHGFAWDGERTLYLDNRAGTRIDRFTTGGKFIDSKATQDLGRGRQFVAGYLVSGGLITASGISGEWGARLSVIDTDGSWRVTDTLSVVQSGNHTVLEGTSILPVISAVDNKIAVSDLTRYRYTLYSQSYVESQILERPRLKIEPPAMWDSPMGPSFTVPSRFYPVVSVGSNYLMAGGRWPERPRGIDFYRTAFRKRQSTGQKQVNQLDIFEAETGRLVRSLNAADHGLTELLASDSEGRIYAKIEADTPVLGRFRVEIRRPGSATAVVLRAAPQP